MDKNSYSNFCSFMPNFLKNFLFALFTIPYILIADEIYENDLSFRLPPQQYNYEYKVCKRPLSIGLNKALSISKSFDFECLEDDDLNTQHFHFFKISTPSLTTNFDSQNHTIKYPEYAPQNILKPYIQKECYDNNFSNFGYFDDSILHCDENDTSDYHSCSSQTFSYEEIQSALGILMNDFDYSKYDVKNYNCQSFTKNLFVVLKFLQSGLGPACIPYGHLKNKNTLGRIFTAFFNCQDKKNNWFPLNDSLKWEKTTEQYQCPAYKLTP
jgi:hypothetical protein